MTEARPRRPRRMAVARPLELGATARSPSRGTTSSSLAGQPTTSRTCRRRSKPGAGRPDADADLDSAQQQTDVETLINDGADVLDSPGAGPGRCPPAIEIATERGMPIIAYDRLIEDPELLYLTFDNVGVGEAEAEAPSSRPCPSGNYVLIKGDPGDPNASTFLPQGWDDAGLADKIDAGEITSSPTSSPTAGGPRRLSATWRPSSTRPTPGVDHRRHPGRERQHRARRRRARSRARASIPIPLSGQDGDTANLQNVAAGWQYVDVWKNANELGKVAGAAALQLCAGIAAGGPDASPRASSTRSVDAASRRATSARPSRPPGGNTVNSFVLQPTPAHPGQPEPRGRRRLDRRWTCSAPTSMIRRALRPSARMPPGGRIRPSPRHRRRRPPRPSDRSEPVVVHATCAPADRVAGRFVHPAQESGRVSQAAGVAPEHADAHDPPNVPSGRLRGDRDRRAPVRHGRWRSSSSSSASTSHRAAGSSARRTWSRSRCRRAAPPSWPRAWCSSSCPATSTSRSAPRSASCRMVYARADDQLPARRHRLPRGGQPVDVDRRAGARRRARHRHRRTPGLHHRVRRRALVRRHARRSAGPARDRVAPVRGRRPSPASTRRSARSAAAPPGRSAPRRPGSSASSAASAWSASSSTTAGSGASSASRCGRCGPRSSSECSPVR